MSTATIVTVTKIWTVGNSKNYTVSSKNKNKNQENKTTQMEEEFNRHVNQLQFVDLTWVLAQRKNRNKTLYDNKRTGNVNIDWMLNYIKEILFIFLKE